MNENKSTPIDAFLLILVLALAGLGLMMLLSASTFTAEQKYGDPYYFFQPQVRNMLIGLVLMLGLSRIPYQFWAKLAYPVLFASMGLLLLVFVPGIGHSANSANRWIQMPGFTFQPSELAKLAVVIFLAYSLSRKGEKNSSFFYGFVPHLLIVGALSSLILAGRDLGTAMCVAVIAFTMMFVGGSKIWHMLVLAAASVPMVYYQIVSHEFRVRRIMAFLDPWADPEKSGYHIIHSFYAFATGGLWGQGPGGSMQKLFFMPESHTDFIFSVVAEETGFIGVTLIAILFLVLVIRGVSIARSAPDFCGVYMALGCTMIVGLPAFFNMCVVTALVPTKGLPLPFFSYGGTNLLICFAAMGLLMNIAGQGRALRPQTGKSKVSRSKSSLKEAVARMKAGRATGPAQAAA